MINKFKGPHAFLSNFYPAPITWAGQRWPTSEHAYQAAKTLDTDQRTTNLPTPTQAKKAGKKSPSAQTGTKST